MTQAEIKELSTPELVENISEAVINLNRKKLNHSVSEIENPMEIKAARKTVARLKTELRARQMAETSPSGAEGSTEAQAE